MQDSSTPGFRIVVLSGPSGSGKTTIVQRLLAESPVPLQMSISATTRPPRVNEVDGRDYYFLSHDEFEQRRNNAEFLECAEVFRTGHWYGTLLSEVDRIRNANAWALLEIDVEGAQRVMAQFPDAVSIFLMTPSVEEFERRLRQRGTESEEIIQRRLQTAQQELESSDSYRFRVVNDELDRAVREITGILAASAADGTSHA